jgi:3-hydroxyisobutyrate dehydrogenase-like beta-hydroxyacid dehydrogenase
MEVVPLSDLVEADFVLSVLPPSAALACAERLAPLLSKSTKKPVYVDCNAVSPRTARDIDAIVSTTGAAFVDAGIIGPPPKLGETGPRFYASGEHASRVVTLKQYGLDIRVVDGPIGAASALKLSFAGINKGITAIATAMILAADRAGARQGLCREIEENWPTLSDLLSQRIGDMIPKAYRWVGEMREIAEFVAEDTAAEAIFSGASRLYDRVARDAAANGDEVAALRGFFQEKKCDP